MVGWGGVIVEGWGGGIVEGWGLWRDDEGWRGGMARVDKTQHIHILKALPFLQINIPL